MIDTLIALNIYTYPVAFALLFTAGTRLFFRTRHRLIAVFSIGMGLVLISQVILFGGYQLFPVVYDQNVGVVSHEIRDSLFRLSSGLNALGLLVGSLALTLFSFKPSSRSNVT